MRHIVFLHQHWRWPEEGGAIRMWHLATACVQAGYEVSVITGTTAMYPESGTERREGITLHRVGVEYQASMGKMRRIWAFLSFAFLAWLKLVGMPKCLVYASSTPITVGAVALASGRRFVFEVRDPWPEIPVAMGIIKSGHWFTLGYWAHKLAQACYRNAVQTVFLSEAALTPEVMTTLKHAEARGSLPPLVAPNFFGAAQQVPVSNRSTSYLTLLYGGAIGAANAPNQIADIAYALQYLEVEGKRWRLVLVPEKHRQIPSRIQEALQAGALELLGYMSKQEYQATLQQADMVLVSFMQLEALGATSPNKFYEAVAYGKPVLAAMPGPLATNVQEYGMGIRYDTEGRWLAGMKNCLSDYSQLIAMQHQVIAYQKNLLPAQELIVSRLAEIPF